MATRIVDELITLIGFKTSKNSEREIKKMKNGISSLRKQALLAGAAFAGFGIAAEKIVQGVDQQAKFARGIGLTFQKLREFQFAAQKAGASTSEFNSFIGNLARTITSLQPGELNRTLLRLGVAARDSAGKIRPLDQVILDISEKLKRFGPIRRQQFVQQLGGSFNIANFLGQGSAAIRQDLQQAISSGFVIPERLTGQFAEFFDDTLLKLKSTIRGFSEVMIASLLPAISEIIENLDKWILKNKELLATEIGDFLKGAGEAVKFFGNGLKFALDAFSAILKPLGMANEGLSNAKVLGFAAASAVTALAAAATLAAGEWVLLAGAIAAVIGFLPKLQLVDDFVGSLVKKSKFTRDVSDFFKNFAKPFDVSSIAGSAFSAIAPSTATTDNSSQTSTINNTFNINGARSPEETARRVREEIELSAALQSSNPGFNRPKVG